MKGFGNYVRSRMKGSVDIADRRLSQTEYWKRMSQAWLTWSPEGLGWDCFRHYEAPLAGSIPVINSPTIVRYVPLIDGVHAFYYQPDDPKVLVIGLRRLLVIKFAYAKWRNRRARMFCNIMCGRVLLPTQSCGWGLVMKMLLRVLHLIRFCPT